RAFLEMLMSDGIAEPEAFMRSSLVVQQHSPTWLPHVTLATGHIDTPLGIELVHRQLEFGAVHVRRSV
ncbi:MAG: hypothetical protein ACRDUX_17225, partial [Mycobacterium sp.]